MGRQASKATPNRTKAPSILTTVLPSDPSVRLERLRAHAGGRLPLFERYRAGDHRTVWSELVALGPAVRNELHAADALAVAHETMQRVESNVRAVVERLGAMGYSFTAEASRVAAPMDAAVHPHLRPHADTRKAIVEFEKRVGVLPLSLRVFYEVVGGVNLIGHHATLAPSDGAVATDPLVVYGLHDGVVEDDGDEAGAPTAITIAPDDLHKADTSGGDPYEMAIPDLRADGELLNERHHLFLVDYLRLCFRFGGFPGYDGIADVPAQVGELAKGLIDF